MFDYLLEQLALMLGRGKQTAADIEVLALAHHRHNAASIARPETFPTGLGNEIRVVVPTESKGEVLQAVHVAAGMLFSLE
jgi:hypothetical protein